MLWGREKGRELQEMEERVGTAGKGERVYTPGEGEREGVGVGERVMLQGREREQVLCGRAGGERGCSTPDVCSPSLLCLYTK